MLKELRNFKHIDPVKDRNNSGYPGIKGGVTMNNKYMVRKLQENRKRRKKVETVKDDTTGTEDKCRQLMEPEENKPCSSNGTTSIIITHASVPENYLILEIQPQMAGSNSGTNSINANERENIKKILKTENRKGSEDQTQDREVVNDPQP